MNSCNRCSKLHPVHPLAPNKTTAGKSPSGKPASPYSRFAIQTRDPLCGRRSRHLVGQTFLSVPLRATFITNVSSFVIQSFEFHSSFEFREFVIPHLSPHKPLNHLH